MTWAFLALLLVATLRPPNTDSRLAWVLWFLVCCALLAAACVTVVVT